jgi:hypothetical protein
MLLATNHMKHTEIVRAHAVHCTYPSRSAIGWLLKQE